MPNRNDPGFSNEFAVQAGFPSSGEMQQRAGQGGLPPQRQQMPFEHKRAPATNQAVPYVQPVMQGTPAAQGSQYQVRQQQISPGVASFLRANAIDQGARGVEQRLGQIENQMQGMGSPQDAAVRSMAQMRSGRDTQQAPRQAPPAVMQAAEMARAHGLGGQMAPQELQRAAALAGGPGPYASPGQAFDPRTGVAPAGQMARENIAYQRAQQDLAFAKSKADLDWAKQMAERGFGRGQAGRVGGAPGMQVGALARGGFPTALPPGMRVGALTGGMPVVPQQRVADVEQMRRGVAPAVAPIQPGVAPVGAQMPDAGMMGAMFPQGFVPTPIEDRLAFQREGGEGGEVGAEAQPQEMAEMQEVYEEEETPIMGAEETEETPIMGAEETPIMGAEEVAIMGSEGVRPDKRQGISEEKEKSPSQSDEDYWIRLDEKLDQLEANKGKLAAGMLEEAKQQVQQQKDYLHAALSEAGGGILAGGAPLLGQESVNAAKAMVNAKTQIAKMELAIDATQAGILGGMLSQQGKMDLGQQALDLQEKNQNLLAMYREDDLAFRERSFDEKLAWSKDSFNTNMEFLKEKYADQKVDKEKLTKMGAFVTAVQLAAKLGYEPNAEALAKMAKIIASGETPTEEEIEEVFGSFSKASDDEEGSWSDTVLFESEDGKTKITTGDVVSLGVGAIVGGAVGSVVSVAKWIYDWW